MTPEQIAKDIAHKAHFGQKRWNGDAYITHPARVANSLALPLDRVLGWLHDVVEDTDITFADIGPQFDHMGPAIMYYLDLLTKRPDEHYVDYIERLAQDRRACLIKLADLKDNMSDLKDGQRKDKYELTRLYLRERLK